MIHAYSLVHDDLPSMDDDTMRRGRPTCHVAFGEATALLAGDALQSQAFEVLCRARMRDAAGACAWLAHASGVAGMAGGQAIDLDATGSAMDERALEMMHRMKTGALIRAAVRLGAAAAPALPQDAERHRLAPPLPQLQPAGHPRGVPEIGAFGEEPADFQVGMGSGLELPEELQGQAIAIAGRGAARQWRRLQVPLAAQLREDWRGMRQQLAPGAEEAAVVVEGRQQLAGEARRRGVAQRLLHPRAVLADLVTKKGAQKTPRRRPHFPLQAAAAPLGGGASNGAIRLTTARYYTPSGRSIQAKGIDPDVIV